MQHLKPYISRPYTHEFGIDKQSTIYKNTLNLTIIVIYSKNVFHNIYMEVK